MKFSDLICRRKVREKFGGEKCEVSSWTKPTVRTHKDDSVESLEFNETVSPFPLFDGTQSSESEVTRKKFPESEMKKKKFFSTEEIFRGGQNFAIFGTKFDRN